MKIGDHLVSTRTGYSHHGIFAGNEQVIHYSGFSNGLNKGIIEITSIDEFKNGSNITIRDYIIRTYSHEEALERAYSRCGEDWYNVLLNNCEHFATWCVMGLHSSSQVNTLIGAAGLTKLALFPLSNNILRQIANTTATNTIRSAVTTSAVSTLVPTTSAWAGTSSVVSALAPTTSALVSTSSVVSALAPTTSALVGTGIGAGAGIAASGVAGVATAGLVGIASVSAAPVVAAAAVGAAVGYGAKKVWDWLTD